MHIDIREELTREIAYGKSTSCSRVEETLRLRKSYPVYTTSMDDQISLRIGEDDRTDEIEKYILLVLWDSWFLSFRTKREILLCLFLSLSVSRYDRYDFIK